MKDLKEVLTFIGLHFTRFLSQFILNALYLLVVIAVTLVLFFFVYRPSTTPPVWVAVLYLLVFIVVDCLVKRSFFRKRQLIMNATFVRYMETKEPVAKNEKLSLPEYDQVKKDVERRGLGFLPSKLLFAVAVLPDREEVLKRIAYIKPAVLRLLALEAGLFILLAAPFFLISYFFTRGFDVNVQLLIYLTGLFFVYFLDAAIFSPLVRLLIQEKIRHSEGLGCRSESEPGDLT